LPPKQKQIKTDQATPKEVPIRYQGFMELSQPPTEDGLKISHTENSPDTNKRKPKAVNTSHTKTLAQLQTALKC